MYQVNLFSSSLFEFLSSVSKVSLIAFKVPMNFL